MSSISDRILPDWPGDDWQEFVNEIPKFIPLIDVVCILTPDQEFVCINEDAAAAYGMTPEDFVGRKCFGIVHDQDEPIDDCPCLQTLETGAPAVGDVFEENGRHYLPATAPIFNEDGDVQAIAHSIQDVTQQKNALTALERNKALLNSTELLANVGGWELDLKTETVRWTDGTCDIHDVSTGYTPNLEHTIEFFHPDDREEVEQVIEQCRKHGISYDTEVRLITAEGRMRLVEITGDRIERGDRTVLRGAIKVITDRKLREQQLAVLNRILRHNLRNSLNVVEGHASLLSEKLDNDLQQQAETIKDQADKLKKLSEKASIVEDLFDHAPRGAMRYDLGEFLPQIAAEIHEEYPDAVIDVTVPPSISIQADERLEPALREVIENAIVYNDQATPEVSVTAESSGESGPREMVEVEIADNGPGIPEQELVIMDEGEQTPLFHGTGIGLLMIHWIVVSFGGEVTIRENEPRGSIVTLRLPA